MKKLMIAAAIVCATVIAQAGAVKWNWSSTAYNGYLNSGNTSTDYEGKAGQAGTMYIFNSNASGVSQNAILNAFLAGTDIASLSMDNYVTAAGTMSTAAAKQLSTSHDTFPDVRIDGSSYWADVIYAMVIDDNIFISETYSKKLGTTASATTISGTISTQTAKFQGEAKKDGFTAGGWYSASVPEPTSGLLMLLGVAGLALRRRRA